MNNRPYIVKCLDAKYDEENEMLVLACFFEDLGEKKLVVFSRSNFYFKQPGMLAPHIEMYKTSRLFRGKRFNIEINDDPNREKITDENYAKYTKMFGNTIVDELGKVQEGLADDTAQIQRKLGRMKKEGKLDAAQLLREEKVVQATLGPLNVSGLS